MVNDLLKNKEIMNIFTYIIIGILAGAFWFLIDIKIRNYIAQSQESHPIDYSKNHEHIQDIIAICLENDRIRYEDLLQIHILDPSTDEFKFELLSRFSEKMSYRIGELEQC